MATYAYLLLSSDPDSNFLQACDIGKSDGCFLDKASFRSVSVLKRPGFLEARKALRKGDTFVVASIDCLSTNPKELLGALESLKRRGVTIVFVRQGITLSTALGKAYLRTLRTLVMLQGAMRLKLD
ncbi:recombinase family protein [Pseudomonas syringae]|uniref:recombinase family protein n=1 Tax=Pseudomonas syringae TaxID=317 RepID=UPI001CA8DCEF|nr:recombinase family protein [Pseudomonas syringae]